MTDGAAPMVATPPTAMTNGSAGPGARLLATDASRSRVLVELTDSGGLDLLRLEGIGERDESFAPVTAAVERLLGRAQPVLRMVPMGRVDAGDWTAFVEIEPLAAGAAVPGIWVDLADAHALGARYTSAGQRFLRRWLDELQSGVIPPLRPRWSTPGFHARAGAWMAERLAHAGTPLTSEPTVLTTWCLSSVLRGETEAGPVFLKACARVFDREPEITAAMDKTFPGAVTSVVATHSQEGWLLMRGAGRSVLGEEPATAWEDGLTALARLQRAWPAADPPLDLEDRGPGSLASTIPELIESSYVRGFPADVLAQLESAAPRLIDTCRRLASLPPGPTFVHGDFHPWNVQRDGDGVVIIDWSDSAIGHPFTDLPTFLGRTKDPAVRRRLLDAYLDAWAGAAPRSELEEAAHLALAVGAIHQVESYRRIMETLEPDEDWGLAGAGPSYVRRALAWLEDGLEAEG